MQPGGEQSLNHAVVQFASNAIAIVEHLETSLRIDELSRGLEPLADVSYCGHCGSDLATQRAERDLDRNLAARTVQRGEQQPAAHRPSLRAVGVALAIGAMHAAETTWDQHL